MKKPKYIKKIVSHRGLFDFNIKDLWNYKGLLYLLSWRDIKVMYKQTILGVVWAVLQPVVTMIIFTMLFGKLAKIDSNGIPYPIFVYSGLLFWGFFSSSLTSVSMSITNAQAMIRKIYFPRIIIPVATVATNAANFLISSIVFMGLVIYYRYTVSISVVVVYFIVFVISFISALGPGLFLAAINVKFRDVKHALPFFINTLLYITPVIYPVSLFNSNLRYLLAINPLTSYIQLMRDTMFGTHQVDLTMLLISTSSSLILLFIGLIYFNKNQDLFSDQL